MHYRLLFVNMRLFLIGFMGSGKTHWGKILSQKLAIPFADLDSLIVAEEQHSVAEIFKINGEDYFRSREEALLRNFALSHPEFVLSCGGGTPCFNDNIRFMKQQGVVIWLNTPVKILRERLILEQKSRPLISTLSPEALGEYITHKLRERHVFYGQAHLVVDEHSITTEQFIHLLKPYE